MYQVLSHVIVYAAILAVALLLLKVEKIEGTLRAVWYASRLHLRLEEIHSAGSKCVRVRIGRTYSLIGRRTTKVDLSMAKEDPNDTDMNISRIHAVLEYVRGEFRLRPVLKPADRFWKNLQHLLPVIGKRTAEYTVIRHRNIRNIPPEGVRIYPQDTIQMGDTRLQFVNDEVRMPPQVYNRDKGIQWLLAAVCLGFLAVWTWFVSKDLEAAQMQTAGLFCNAMYGLMVLYLAGTAVSIRRSANFLSFVTAITVLLAVRLGYHAMLSPFNYLEDLVFTVISIAAGVLTCYVMRWSFDETRQKSLGLYCLIAGCIVALECLHKRFQNQDAGASINLAGLSLQPGEFVRILLMLMAVYSVNSLFRQIGFSVMSLWVCFRAAVSHDDFGMAVPIFAVTLVAMYLLFDQADNKRLLRGMILMALAAFVIAVVLVPKVRMRITGWFHPFRNYQQREFTYAVMLSGWQGLGAEYSHIFTDVFAAENDGALLGVMAVFGVPVLLAVMLCFIGLVAQASCNYGVCPEADLILAQTAALIAVQAMLNFAGSAGVLPFSGTQAILISAGGSSIIATGVLLGMTAAALSPRVILYQRSRGTDYEQIDQCFQNFFQKKQTLLPVGCLPDAGPDGVYDLYELWRILRAVRP